MEELSTTPSTSLLKPMLSPGRCLIRPSG